MKTKNEKIGIGTHELDGIYFLDGSSKFLKFEGLTMNFNFIIEKKKKKFLVIFYFEYLYPNHADFMMSCSVDLDVQKNFYKDENFMKAMMTDLYNTSFNGYNDICKIAEI